MKTHFDVFNGDADGICALQQLRLAVPKESVLISGVKRDIALLDNVNVDLAQDVTVLDISLKKNHTALHHLLSKHVRVFYVDHHDPGEIPTHPFLTTHIHTQKNMCTSLIVDKLLRGKYRQWALVGAYGDNLISVANTLAKKEQLSFQEREKLRSFGTYLNYNAYGACLSDLIFSPVDIYTLLSPYISALSFIYDHPEIYSTLEDSFLEDKEKAAAILPYSQSKGSRVFMLPDAPWARRISGVYSNELANQDPCLANAVISESTDDHYVVSIRSPLNVTQSANELAALFPTGGGRKGAAGINALPKALLCDFICAFHQHYQTTN